MLHSLHQASTSHDCLDAGSLGEEDVCCLSRGASLEQVQAGSGVRAKLVEEAPFDLWQPVLSEPVVGSVVSAMVLVGLAAMAMTTPALVF